MNTQTLSLSFAPQIEVEVDQGVDTPKRFMGVAYSGGLIPGYGYFGDAAIDLASLTVPNKSVFALLNHDPDQRVGKLVLANNRMQLDVAGSFSQATEAGRQVAAEFAEGAPWEFSVGIQATPEVFEKPKTLEVNGQSLTVNTLFRNATIREVSFVPAGADPNTQAIAFQKHSDVSEFQEEVKMSDELKAKLDSVNQLNVDLNIKLEAMKTEQANVLASLTAQLDSKEQLLLSAKQEANRLADELSTLRQSIRLSAVKELFAELDLTFSDEKAKTYLDMSDGMFESIKADLSMMKRPNVKDSYFVETATRGKEKADVDFAAQLLKQVAGVK